MLFARVIAVLLLLAPAAAGAQTPRAPIQSYEVVASFPHDPGAFTQGLLFQDGVIYESTGLHGRSSIRKVDPATGKVLQKRDVDARYFGEGIVAWQDRLIEITWQDGAGFIYDLKTFEPKGQFAYKGEGWGLTHDGDRIIMSDGTDELRFLDPQTLEEKGRVKVTDGGGSVFNLNEIEWIEGEVWANVWGSDWIARIDPATGKVKAWIDMTGLLPAAERSGSEDVLNGIAYDAKAGRVLVTGKLWPKVFEIRVRP
ncbi:MAG: glutaminyl-peptide cyclotransferase [Caulobacter sp.]|nr:glutaminyl-peptide cyclotransferase [Caulobacter sp.]